ncbi:protein-L-isoaspartate O-methyltransferase [Acidocella aquatica]|uniref:Protein-L-isoaspartate O-methyltransferase n=1 Tax=Acidocella aquatica TaxID=1922313 RepID=A0ABQ6A1H3_9PROT|nr:protein-L-isoaspartate O-methyltransferase [Acidocella aquatica]GLR66309.1 protein-L-isoaspartate O-methyltransferase [Acidocella aquatica]
MTQPATQDIARNKMVDGQVRPNQVSDPRVIEAMRSLPREAFAPAGALAYADTDIDLGQGRFLASPLVTARLAQLVLANNPAEVLVVGAGSGYLAAVLAACGARVVALEEEARLQGGALAQYAPEVESVCAPLAAGYPAGGPYDVIVIEGAVPAIPENFASQLAPGGRVVAILADGDEPGGLGRAVSAEAVGKEFVTVRAFDCTARILPAFRRAPAFSL